MDFKFCPHAESGAFTSKNLKHTHSKATCYVEDNDTAFIIFFAKSTNSAKHPDAEQDDHVDSAAFATLEIDDLNPFASSSA